MDQIKSLHKQLKTEFDKGNARNLSTIETLIEKLKVESVALSFLPTSPSDKSTNTSIDLLVVQRDTLEISALTAVLKRDPQAFQCAIAQLKHYYGEIGKLSENTSIDSPLKYQMLGLNLMHLLADNKLPEFHMELERIPFNIVADNVFISTPVKLEQYLMEGTYNKIFVSKSNVPSPYYTYFIEILLDTVRDEIANCIQKAYDRLSVTEAVRLLFFDGKSPADEALKYAKKKNWNLSADKTGFVFINEEAKKQDDRFIDSTRLASQHIFYAKQLEMIV